jgi:hypothetical protein
VTKAYEEADGKILNFHCEKDQMFAMVQTFNGVMLKIFDVQGTEANFTKEVLVKDEKFISFNLSCNSIANGILMN